MNDPKNVESEDQKIRSESPSTSTAEQPKEEASGTTDGAPVTSVSEDFDWFEDDTTEETGMWVFGYGSLCWNPGFSFKKSLTGFVRGFSRKFWQGNTTHRGTLKKPGRVATLIKDPEGMVWGQAYQVAEKEAFLYLNNRECKLGGYLTTISTFFPRQVSKGDNLAKKPFPVILYLATPSNHLWLGDSPLGEIANQIIECTGNSGHNVEYLLRLANFVRENIPEAVDEHLFTLEDLVRTKIKERKLCLKTLMGEKKMKRVAVGGGGEQHEDQQHQQPEAGDDLRADSLQYASKVPSKKLRCVNI